MSFYHLWLLIEKSIRYARRRQICRCPKILFEFLIPTISILLLCLIRWIHTPSSNPNNYGSSSSSSSSPDIKSNHIKIEPLSIKAPQEPIKIFTYTSKYRCPLPEIPIEIYSNDTYHRFKQLCPRSHFNFSSFSTQSIGRLLLNTSLEVHTVSYRCQYYNQYWCEHVDVIHYDRDLLQMKHPSSYLCSHSHIKNYNKLLRAYLAVESLLSRPINKQQLSVLTWPCSSYAYDPLFSLAPRFVLIVIFILIDGCILFGFYFLLHELVLEKHHGIIEHLRLLSIHPLLNSLAWFVRILTVQIIISLCLVLVLKVSISGGIYLAHVPIWLVLPSILLWSIQVLSQCILMAHFFNSVLRALLWSWFIYFLSFWLALSSSIELSMPLHLIAATWLPFYAIKRLLIGFIQINTDVSHQQHFIKEVIYIWLSMIAGCFFKWCLAIYFERLRPGKYGIPQPWTWPLDYIRNRKRITSAQRPDTTVPLIETPMSSDKITVQINDLTKTFGRHNADRQLAVDHISMALENSRIYGLIGPNGAGKTTIMEMLCGLLSCDCGTIAIHDKDLFDNLHEIQSCIGYCPQYDMLFSYLTVQEQLEFYAHVRANSRNIDHNQIQELLSMIDMNKYNQQLCYTLSGGMQRKLSILCSFVGQVNIIVLDEPSSSLDPVARRKLWSWLREHKANRTLLISSHLLDEIEELCDSVIILDSGRIRAQGTILSLKQQYGPQGDRLYLETLPPYIPNEWIIDHDNHHIEIPDRQQLVETLEQLERDQIQHSLINTTLDEVFVKLTSTYESFAQDENNMKSQMNKLFELHTRTDNTHLCLQQALAVLVRRSQVLLKRARLLPFIIFLYLIYSLASLYLPSLARSSEPIRYIISSTPDQLNKLKLTQFDIKIAPYFNSSRDFQQYLLDIPIWSWNHRYRRKYIGIRIISSDFLECFVPSPVLSNIINTCLPIFSIFSKRSMAPLQLIGNEQKLVSFTASTDLPNSDFYCLYTLPVQLHVSILLVSLMLIVSAALVIQDYASGLHSYSLIHGLRSWIHWLIIFLSDFILCILWLLIVILIARIVHSSTFDGRFFALMPLYFMVDLPFIYLLAKLFKAPVLGAIIIVFTLQLAHVLNSFNVLIELLRGFRTLTILIYILRWLLLITFPNVNVFTLTIAILRDSHCPSDDFLLAADENAFSHERYQHKILIHTLIFILQFILYTALLFIFDTSKLYWSGRKIQGVVNHEEEDDDVRNERHRIMSMNDQVRQREALVVNNLSKRYRHVLTPAVNRLTFAVPHRQCFGLLGFNGSGKTTTFRMLVGELRPTSGYIYKNETIGYCPQNDIHFSALTVQQSIDYICRLHGLNPMLLSELVLSQFQLEKYRKRLVSHLSGGTRRRLHLALCLIGSPKLLLLDEPTAKIDPLLRHHIRVILQHRPIDTSIIFASHSMLECEQLCDRLTILVRGTAKCLGSPEHLKNKYGIHYRIRLTLLDSSFEMPLLTRVDNSNEYTYPRASLAYLFNFLEKLVKQNIIASNYTIELTSLEHVFLTFQHSSHVNV